MRKLHKIFFPITTAVDCETSSSVPKRILLKFQHLFAHLAELEK